MKRNGFRLYLFGAPQLGYEDQPVAMDTRKALALLAYLAITGQTHRRDSLAALLWSDYNQSGARAALRRTISTLHKATGARLLDIHREEVGLLPDAPLWVDAVAFERQAAGSEMDSDSANPDTIRQRYLSAVQLVQGEFMAGFSLRDSPVFEDWQFQQSEYYRRLLLNTLDRWMAFEERCARPDLALTVGRRRLLIDPLDESVHRKLMEAYAALGQRSEALRQYERCERLLQDELGVDPLPETRALVEAIRSGAYQPLPRVVQAPPGPPAPPLAEPELEDHPPAAAVFPLVGREAEWRALRSLADRARGPAQLVGIEGEAGIGKTRLVQELSATLRQAGWRVLEAGCYEAEQELAYSPVLALLQHWRRLTPTESDLPGLQGALQEAARLDPGLLRLVQAPAREPPAEPAGAKTRLLEALRQLLLPDGPQPAPTAILVDDAQWVDQASLDVLTYLAHRLPQRPGSLVVAAWRTEASPAVRRMRSLVGAARRAGHGTLLILERLAPEAIRRLAAHTGRAGDEEFARRLATESEGLPFFAVEYLRALQQDALTGWEAPQAVRDLVQARLSALGEIERQVVEAASVISRSFDFATARAASGRSADETAGALERLLGAGIIREDAGQPEPRYDFTHEKIRAEAYASVPGFRKQLLHLRVAEFLATRSHAHLQSEPFVATAYHFRLGGEPALAATYSALAGDQARAVYANHEALAHYQAALAAGHPERSQLLEAVGDLFVLVGQYADAHSAYLDAANHRTTDLGVLQHKLGLLHQRQGAWEVAEEHFEQALHDPGLADNPALRARILADWSLAAHARGAADRAQELVHQAGVLAAASQDPLALAQAFNSAGVLARAQGRLEEGVEHLTRSLEHAQILPQLAPRIAALNNLALVFAEQQAYPQAIDRTRTALELAGRIGDQHRLAALYNNLADLLHASGQNAAAMDALKQAVQLFAETNGAGPEHQAGIWKLVEW